MKNKKIVLMYHSIGNRGSSEVGAQLYAVSEENFLKQMQYLRNAKYLPGGKAGSIRNTIITFDDGLLDGYTVAFPILKSLNIRAYYFILVSKVGFAGHMDWLQIKELRDAGMIIGSHGMNHKILTILDDKELDCEIRQSKKIIEENLGEAIDYFSIPRGFSDEKIIKKCKEAGYKSVFSSDIKDADEYKFGRISVKGNYKLNDFIRIINNGFTLAEKIKNKSKDVSKIILGANKYDKLRTGILNSKKLKQKLDNSAKLQIHNW